MIVYLQHKKNNKSQFLIKLTICFYVVIEACECVTNQIFHFIFLASLPNLLDLDLLKNICLQLISSLINYNFENW